MGALDMSAKHNEAAAPGEQEFEIFVSARYPGN
jgi:hypothetical protein